MPDHVLKGFYDYPLVVLSVFISILAACAALDLAGRITSSRGNIRFAWMSGGALAMGTGIWSMHYVGMLAYHLPLTVRYDWPTVLLSLLAIAASGGGLFIASRHSMGLVRSLVGSVFMGSGIAAMHYLGMEAMRLNAMCSYSPGLVIVSVALAIIISFVALRLTFTFREKAANWGWQKVLCALTMGTAIPVMHYVGMAAVDFVPSPMRNADLTHAVSISALGLISIVTITVISLGLVFLQERRAVPAACREHPRGFLDDGCQPCKDHLPQSCLRNDLGADVPEPLCGSTQLDAFHPS